VQVEVLQVSVARRRIELRLRDSKGRAPGSKRGKRGKQEQRQPKKDRSERRRELRGKNQRRKKK